VSDVDRPTAEALMPEPARAAPSLARVAGIVLAGGMSRRFEAAATGTPLGPDKLAAPFGGEPLLHAAVRSVAAVTDEVIVAIRPDGDEPALPADLPVPVRFVRDMEEGGGPLAALPRALDATSAPLVLVVAGDTPRFSSDIARLLLDALTGPGPARPGLGMGRDRGRALAAAFLVGGSFRPLPAGLRRQAAFSASVDLVYGGERRLRVLLANLGATAIPEAAWRAVDPTGETFRDVDTPGDLAALRADEEEARR
jgi:molybdopterin-guanine dinucleotide biosynthesis protein A